ncbi:M4 family metallopeptidase [Kitasatospora sp. NPDC056181]|uniref:M4 family metallopeptidase n=1 Tax=Kitasatospora sp. NPDC056181 TaxID=3345737 RepID=UPI0035D7E9B5
MKTTATFCTIVPPHILDKLAQSEDPAVSEPARRTLERDALLRTQRRISAGRGEAAPAGTPSDRPQRTIYDAAQQDTLPGAKVHAESDRPAKDQAVNRAHAGLGATFDFYLKAYGRHSIDDCGLPLDATVHYGDNYGNVFWNGEQMVLGDGIGKVLLDFTESPEVIGHELTHGVTQSTANLEYFGQSGALNESVADVFGSLVKQYALGQTADQADWLIGAGLFGPAIRGVALRSLKAPGTAYDDPQLGKDPQPTTMDDYVRTSRDSGGVHINSGIPNHAFYLVASALGGHAWEQAGKIWYATLTGGELAADADFADFARLTAATARSLFGEGDEIQAVLKAWSMVGVPIA